MSRLGELTRKVDAFFARVEARHGTDMQCQTGCSDCCHVRLTITHVEAGAIRAEVAGWPAARREALAHTGPEDRCAALDRAGRCKIYDARPLVCRSHGVPIRLRRGALPVIDRTAPPFGGADGRGQAATVVACHHNFRRTTPEADCVLDQTTLSATLFAIDAAERAPAADPGAARVELAGLLAELAAI